MKINEIIQLIVLFMCMIGGISLVWSMTFSKKEKYLNNINKDQKKINKSVIPKNSKLYIFLDNLTSGGEDINDSVDKVIGDLIKMAIFGSGALLIMALLNKLIFGFIAFVILVASPIYVRILNKSSFQKQYLGEFYDFLNYLTLYVSGGVSVDKAMVEVEKILPKNSVILPRLREVNARRAISGLMGNSFIETLIFLNEGFNFNEIRMFIGTIRRSQERGDALADTLMMQLDSLMKKADINKRTKISAQDGKFQFIIVAYCLMPVIIAFGLPIFSIAMAQLGAVV